MGAGYGFLRDAQNNAKQNRENLKKRIEKRKSQNFKITQPPKFKEASPEEVDLFRKKLLKQKAREKWARIILLITLTCLFGGVFYYFLLK